METLLVLRTCMVETDGRITGYGGFEWPRSGPVAAPDWDPAPRCGYGLHGFEWGGGDGSLANWSPEAMWLVVEVDAATVVRIGDSDSPATPETAAKVKFPAGNVIYAGDRKTATDLILSRRPATANRPVIGAFVTVGDNSVATAGHDGTATAGYRGTATVGHDGTATAGDRGTAKAGNSGTATAGYRGTATAGDRGTATAGSRGTATAGHDGTATVGHDGTATVGHDGTATAGDRGTAKAGYGGELRFRWHDGGRYRTAVGYVGESPFDGADPIEANVPYVCRDGKILKK